MLYMLLICYDPTVERAPFEPVSRQPQHAAVEQEMRAEGIFVSGGALMPPEFAPRVRVRAGHVVDGPFAETKELLGGYYVVDVCGRLRRREAGGTDPRRQPVVD